MSFKYSVIGDNTKENREHQEKIGYVRGFFNIPNRGYIKTINPGIYNLTNIVQPLTEYINCIGNPQLFQAVTAMRDDSDIWQWFKTDFENKLIPDVKEMYLCKSREFCGITVKYKGEDFVIGSAGFHKATLSELQAHFK